MSRNREDFRELIHLLNQRYQREWERAELLQVELTRGRRWSLWRLIELLRPIKRWLRPPAIDPGDEVEIGSWQTVEEILGPIQGRVSIIIPFRDRLELLRNCLRSLGTTTYRRFEVVLVDNGSSEPAHPLLPETPVPAPPCPRGGLPWAV